MHLKLLIVSVTGRVTPRRVSWPSTAAGVSSSKRIRPR
jgi:hypothetical protein